VELGGSGLLKLGHYPENRGQNVFSLNAPNGVKGWGQPYHLESCGNLQNSTFLKVPHLIGCCSSGNKDSPHHPSKPKVSVPVSKGKNPKAGGCHKGRVETPKKKDEEKTGPVHPNEGEKKWGTEGQMDFGKKRSL